MDPLQVLVADDHPMFRQGVRSVLESAPGIEVVAEAATGAEAVAAAREHQPDVVAMDIHMPELNGIEATRQIVETSPHIAVVVLTMLEDDESVFAAMRAGARGYLLKEAPAHEIVRAVQGVAQGEAIFGPTIARRVMAYFADTRSPLAPHAFPQLTDRELEVLELVAQGQNNPSIARSLFVNPKTVRNHVSNIFSKLQVADRAQAIVRAREAGLGRGPRPLT